MSESLRRRWARRYKAVKERDERWLFGLDLGRVNRILLWLFVAFILLNLIDVVSTLAALRIGPPLLEMNPVASGLFRHGFWGFMLALVLKFFPFIPFTYAVFMKGSSNHPVQMRTIKMGFLVALAAADVFYLAVAINDLTNLAVFLH